MMPPNAYNGYPEPNMFAQGSGTPQYQPTGTPSIYTVSTVCTIV